MSKDLYQWALANELASFKEGVLILTVPILGEATAAVLRFRIDDPILQTFRLSRSSLLSTDVIEFARLVSMEDRIAASANYVSSLDEKFGWDRLEQDHDSSKKIEAGLVLGDGSVRSFYSFTNVKLGSSGCKTIHSSMSLHTYSIVVADQGKLVHQEYLYPVHACKEEVQEPDRFTDLFDEEE